MTLEAYLQKHHTPGSVKRYLHDIERFQRAAANHKTATYEDIIHYLGELRKHYKPGTVNTILCSLKAYYRYLIDTGQRADHPCRFIKIRDSKPPEVQLQRLFSEEELASLLKRRERYSALKTRNRVIITLLIYQGLTTGEITRLTPEDIDLQKGEIHIQGSQKLNGRTLHLKPDQILLLHSYIKEERPKLLKTSTDKLIITKRGLPEKGEGIHYLTETLRPLFSGRRLNPKTIRMSVIHNLLKQGYDLRVVQHFAGHKKPSSTERYREADLKALQSRIDHHHPLG